MAVYALKFEQKVPAEPEQIWSFLTSHANLLEMTPPEMNFTILSKDLAQSVYPGMMIHYSLTPILGIKMKWLTQITQRKEMAYFVDEQRTGPYKIWHHEHHIAAIPGGTLITDLIHYVPPLGFLGDIANRLFIKDQLQQLFKYRMRKMVEKFGNYGA